MTDTSVQDRGFFRNRRRALSFVVPAGIVLIALAFWVDSLHRRWRLEEMHQMVRDDLTFYSYSISTAFTELTAKLDGLKSFVAARKQSGDIGRSEFDMYTSGLHVATPWARTFQLVENGVIRYTYPLKGNESVVGVDLMKDPRPFIGGDVLRAFERNAPTITGPTALIQGGTGMIIRTPVPSVQQGMRDLAAVVVDVDAFLARIGLTNIHDRYHIWLVDSSGTVFSGDSLMTRTIADPERLEISLPDGSWRIYGAPAAGWEASIMPTLLMVRVVLVLLALLLMAVIFLVVDRNTQLTRMVRLKTGELEHTNELLQNDIAEKEAIQRSLAESEAHARGLLRANPDMIFVVAADGTVLETKEADDFPPMVNLDLTIGKRLQEFLTDDLATVTTKNLERVLNTRRPVTHEYQIDYRGGLHDFEARYVAAGENRVVIMVREITEQKRAQDDLRVSEERYRTLFEDDLTGDYIAEPDGTITSCNRSFARMFGWETPGTVTGRSLEEFFSGDRTWSQFVRDATRQRHVEYARSEYKTRDGSVLYAIENVSAIFAEDGSLKEIRGYIFDDTKRELLERQFMQSQKLESLGTLAGGIAHDFNNILSIIIGHASLQDSVPASEVIRKKLDAIVRAGIRGSALVNQLLLFARKTEVEVQPLCLNDIVGEAVQLVKETFPRTVVIEVTERVQRATVEGDPTQIHQVLLNLFVNARDAMPDGGSLSIDIFDVAGEELRGRFPAARTRRYVGVQITDTGEGMSDEVRRRVFEPFFTTKARGKGTGLGLSLVFGIMESHGGLIDVQSAPGKGATFTLLFPLMTADGDDERGPSQDVPQAMGGSETILLVEDEEMLREIAEATLRSQGYDVVSASDGQEALGIVQARGADIGILVTDLDLPFVDGFQVYQKAREVVKGLRCIVVSGFVDPSRKAKMMSAGVGSILDKPYLPDDLVRAVRAGLDDHRQ